MISIRLQFYHFSFCVFIICLVSPSFGQQDSCGGCVNGGTCLWYSERCICATGYSGENCEYPLDNTCGCMNHGTCLTYSQLCVCLDNYYGTQCQYDSYEKYMNAKYGIEHSEYEEDGSFNCEYADNGCQHGGTCLSNGQCYCQDQYTGDSCQDMTDWYSLEEEETDESHRTVTEVLIIAFVIIIIAVASLCTCCICLSRRNAKNERRHRMMAANISLQPREGFQGYRPQWYSQFESIRQKDDSEPRIFMHGTSQPITEGDKSNGRAPSTNGIPLPAISISDASDGYVELTNTLPPPPSYDAATKQYKTVDVTGKPMV